MRAWEFMRSAITSRREGDATIKPEGSLDAEQRRRLKRLANAQRKIRKESHRRATKLLRDPKARRP
jgi:hypothetical protein